jgi:MFS family permease
VFSLSWSAAAFIAPIAGAAVLQYVGNAALWLGCFGVGLLVTVIHLLAGPARTRRAAELSAAVAPPATVAAPPPARPAMDARPPEAVPVLPSP